MRRNRLLLLAILLLGVGFATVSTTLVMTGNVKIATNNADFDVKFTKAIIDGTDISSTAISEDGKTITFSTKDLSTVGDISKLDFEITNNSVMYDAEVSVECAANGAKKDYYEITKEVTTPIAGKRTEKGKVEVRLLKASVEDFSETFTCTLKVTAAERNSKAKAIFVPKYFAAVGEPTTSSTTDYTTLTHPYYSGTTEQTNVFVGLNNNGQKGVCILKNGSIECLTGDDNTADKIERMKQVFGNDNCSVPSFKLLECSQESSLSCTLEKDGKIYCTEGYNYYSPYTKYNHKCYVASDGEAACMEPAAG